MAQDRKTTGRQSGGGKLTPFGETARAIRLRDRLLLMDMAKAAGVSAGFLSLVETGKKQIPEDLVDKIVVGLRLSNDDRKDLEEDAAISAKEFRIEMTVGADRLDRHVAHAMQTGFAKMSPERKKAILKLLTDEE